MKYKSRLFSYKQHVVSPPPHKEHLSSYAFPAWECERYFGRTFPELPLSLGYSFQQYNEPSPYYTPVHLATHQNWNLSGYFQSPKYFEDCEQEIKEIFNLDYNLKRIQLNYVSIHVRRGDFVGNLIHDVVGKEYYNKGVEKIKRLTELVFRNFLDITFSIFLI